MAKQTFSVGQVLTAAQLTSLQQTAMGGGAASAKTASYTLVAADAGTTISMTSTSATTITVNTGLFAAGDTVFIQNLGSGNCTVTAGTATVSTAGSLILPTNDAGILYFVSTGVAVFYDFIQVGATSPLTTKGDLYTFSSSDARLPVGTNGYTLVADSAEATGLKWAAPAGGGKVLQVVQFTTSTASTVTSATFTDTNITANITPSLATSKVMVIASCATQYFTNGTGLNQVGMGLRLKRNSTLVFDPSGNGGEGEYITDSENSYKQMSAFTTFSYLDSPATTSVTSYTIAIRNNAGSNTAKTSPDSRESSLILMEIGA